MKAFVLIEMGETEPVIQVLKKAGGLIDAEREPRLLLCVHHNLVYNLATVGQHQEAADLLPELKALAALLLFQESACREAATTDLAHQVAAALTRTRKRRAPSF